MLALPPRPVDAMLAQPSYLPHQALHLAAPPLPGSSAYSPAFPSSSIWSALSFYEPVPRAISPAPSTSRPPSSNTSLCSTPSVSRSAHRKPETDNLDAITDNLRPTLSPIETRRPPTPFPHASHRGSFPFQSRQTALSTAPCLPASPSAGAALENGDLAIVAEPHYDRVSASPPPSSAPPFLCRSVTPFIAADAPSTLQSQVALGRVRRSQLSEPIPDLSRVLLSDPEPSATEDDPGSEFERKFVPLGPHRTKVTKLRGPHARSAADVQRFLPPFGAPRCQNAECTDAKCVTCAYLRRRGDVLRTKLLKRDKDRDLWHLHTNLQRWEYAEDRWKLQTLQASYVLGRELALQAHAAQGCGPRSRSRSRSRARL
ncbi:hypothetical protein GSI_02519 [Ganoderma sinense ZZ0214-1]|uniref:Uncharacterized protein n=1 Tax=Ganoderma sinense ZZ0214-1 TaxID=1077348 RepID=A0A2G8SPT9_9APHY|nr:hypothetical protein GSI_02519 [Ganoderma sinense ZZ0214-1]